MNSRSVPENDPTLLAAHSAEQSLDFVRRMAGLRTWQQNAQRRFTQITGESGTERRIGRAQCEIDALTQGQNWKQLRAGESYRDLVIVERDTGGFRRYWSCSAEPIFDDGAHLLGYRGVERDITRQTDLDHILHLQRAAATAIDNRQSEAAALPMMMRTLLAVTDASEVRYWRFDSQDQALQCVFAYDREFTAGESIGQRLQTDGADPALVLTRNQLDDDATEAGEVCFDLRGANQVLAIVQVTLGPLGAPSSTMTEAVKQVFTQLARSFSSLPQSVTNHETVSQLERLLALCSDWRWRQDAQFRFTSIGDFGSPTRLGQRSGQAWQQDYLNMDASSWAAHMALLADRKPFRDLELFCIDDNGQRRWVSVSGEPVLNESNIFMGYTGTSCDISRRKRAEQLLLLEHSITKTLSTAEGSESAARATMQAICLAEEWQCGEYRRVDEAAGVLRFEASWDRFAPRARQAFELARESVFARGIGLGGRVWRDGKPIWVSDCSTDSRMLRKNFAQEAGLRGAFLFPAFADGRVVGVLAFWSHDVREPDEGLLNTMHVLGAQIGQILERKRTEAELRASEERFRALTSLSSDWYWETDEQFRCTHIESSRNTEQWARQRILGKRTWDAGFEVDGEGGTQAHRELLETRQPFRDVTMVAYDSKGKPYYVSVSGEPIINDNREFMGYRGVSREITESRIAEERIRHLAAHDSLTGLTNRAMFTELLNHAIERAKRKKGSLAVLFLDLDRFKFINDALGHEAGDALLVEMAQRFKSCLRAEDAVARVGGDEFVVLLNDASCVENIQTATRKLLSAAMQSVMIGAQECRVTASIGIATYPANGRDEQTLMKAADAAMHQAKSEGKNNFQFFDASMRSNSLQRMTLESNLRMALERNELSLHYQPKLDLKSGKITGVEALLRWDSPQLGSVPPMQFIPIAEELGLIVPLGKWVLRQALEQGVAWRREGLAPVCMAVNLSVRQLSDPDLLKTVREALAETETSPAMLELEITESMLMQDTERAIAILRALRALGVRLALDDFGTGYSSLAQLKRFPINTLKVDRSFIREIAQTGEDSAITEAIISMGKILSLTIVAEGVETAEQETFLRAQACDEIQGFCFSKPLPPGEFAKFFAHRSSGQAA